MQILLAVPDVAVEAALLGRFGRADAGVTVVRRCVDLADLLAAAGSGVAADAVVVSASVRHLDRDAVAALHARGLRVVVVSDPPGGEPSGPTAEGRRWGADGVIGPDPDDVLQALRSPRAHREPAPDRTGGTGRRPEGSRAAAEGRLVAVWGPTGAPGRTTVAVTLADEAARLGIATLLADADTYGAAVAVRLGLLDDLSGLAAACRLAATGRLDPVAMARTAVALDSGVRVLTGLPLADRWSELRPGALDEVWSVARQLAAVTVADCGFGLERPIESQFDPTLPLRDGATLATLAAADTVVCVGRLEPVGLVRLLRHLPAVLDVTPTAHPVIALVGAGRRAVRDPDATDARRLLAERLGLTDVVVVPDDREAVTAAHWSGRTLAEAAPGSPARAALADLAARLAGVAPRRARRLRLRRTA